MLGKLTGIQLDTPTIRVCRSPQGNARPSVWVLLIVASEYWFVPCLNTGASSHQRKKRLMNNITLPSALSPKSRCVGYRRRFQSAW